MTTILVGVLIVALCMAVAVAGLLLVQRLVPLDLRESHGAAVGIIYAALYVMFGMMVGFSANLVLSKYTTAQTTARLEANSVEELFWLAEQLPEPEQARMQRLAVSYSRIVAEEEWPLMKEDRMSPRAEALADELRSTVQGFEPNTDSERAIFAQALERLHDVDEAREVRTLSVTGGLPVILWVILVSLGVDTILFTYFVGMKSTWLHALVIAALSGGIAFILCTLVALDQPFGGDFRIGQDAFELVLRKIEDPSTK